MKGTRFPRFARAADFAFKESRAQATARSFRTLPAARRSPSAKRPWNSFPRDTRAPATHSRAHLTLHCVLLRTNDGCKPCSTLSLEPSASERYLSKYATFVLSDSCSVYAHERRGQRTRIALQLHVYSTNIRKERSFNV